MSSSELDEFATTGTGSTGLRERNGSKQQGDITGVKRKQRYDGGDETADDGQAQRARRGTAAGRRDDDDSEMSSFIENNDEATMADSGTAVALALRDWQTEYCRTGSTILNECCRTAPTPSGS